MGMNSQQSWLCEVTSYFHIKYEEFEAIGHTFGSAQEA